MTKIEMLCNSVFLALIVVIGWLGYLCLRDWMRKKANEKNN
jgi:hypothetical protein